MQAKIAFYVHHHGSGHIMRCLAIARELGNAEVYFLGSNLKHYSALIPKEIICIHLPMDTPAEDDACYFTNENEYKKPPVAAKLWRVGLFNYAAEIY